MADQVADQTRRAGDQGSGQGPTPWLELVSAALGLIIAVGTTGFIGYKAIRGNDSPPGIVVEIDEVTEVPGGHLVRFTAVNKGEATASQIEIEGELTDGAGAVETSRASFDYLPARSQRKGGLFFTRDPRRNELRIRPTGYAEP